MRCGKKYTRLYRLLNDSLSSYTEQSQLQVPLTKLKEKHLLIILSQISKEIRSWDDEHDCHSSRLDMEPDSGDFHDCLSNIVSILVVFLTVESQYVRHSTSNVLLFISNLLVESERDWDEFLRLLCICLEVAMSDIFASSSVSLITRTIGSDSDTSNFTLCVRERLATATWFTVADLIQVLRTIAKHLNGRLLEIYRHCVSCCLSNIQWELLNEIHVTQTGEAHTSFSMGMLHYRRIGSAVSRFVFLGALLQHLCSLVYQSSSLDGTSNERPVFGKIIGIIPKVLHWCFRQQEDHSWMHDSQYLRHKMLMLMIRLSFQAQQDLSTLVLLFQVLCEYFEDLLQLPISGKHTNLDECLEGSPFLSCFADKEDVHSICTCHLQRQAIFLFLNCSFSLIRLSKETDKDCSCATSDSCLTFELQSGQYCCIKKTVPLKLSEWLQRHLPVEMSVDYDFYLENCGTFALSFLQLYMDEDDLLFEVLLTLLSLPFPVDQMHYQENDTAFEEAKGNIIILLSSILHPVRLFHLFLAEFHKV